MADLDLSLSDALTDSVLQPSPESTVERDFMAQLEAEAVDDQVKETVEKADYIPLLDSVDAKADRSTALENGGEEAHEVQKPGAVGETCSKQAGCLVEDPLITPDASMSFAKQADSLAANPDDLLDNLHSCNSDSYAGGDEMDHGLDQIQKKKKKSQGPYEHPESKDQSETPGLDAEHFYHKIGPRREGGGECWEEQLGKSRGQGRKGKSRKKLPEEWAVMAKPFVPFSVATSQNTETAMMDIGGSTLKYPADLCTDMSTNQTPWQMGVCVEQGFEFSTTEVISPLILNSELKATAAPFTMPSSSNRTTHSSFTKASHSGEPVDVLVDTADLDNKQAFYPPLCPENKKAGGDMVHSEMFDSTSSLPESSMQDLPEGDTSPFSPASNMSLGFTQKDEMLASAPPFLSSDTSWLMNDSQMSYSNVLLDFSDISASSHSLPLGLPFETSSPAPLRSPKTNAQGFQSQQKDAKVIKKQSGKSSSSYVRSTTSPDNNVSPQTSLFTSPSYSLSVATKGPGSGLNPAAKPFFPSFADPIEDPALDPNDVSFMKVEKQEEKVEDSVKELEFVDASNRTEQKNVKVEFISNKTLARMEEEEQNSKETESEMNKEENPAIKVEDVEKQTGEVHDKKEKEKLIEEEKMKVEFVQMNEGKKSKMPEVEESVNETEKVEGVEMKDELENKREEDRNEKPKVEEKEVKKKVINKEENEKDKDDEKKAEVDGIKAESKTSDKVENKEKTDNYETAEKIENKEQHKMETTGELQSRCINTQSNKIQADLEMKAGPETHATEMENTEAKQEEANKMEKDNKDGKPSEDPVDKEQKTKQIKQDNVQAVQKDKSVKSNEEKAKKPSKPASETRSAAVKDHMSANKKMKTATAAPKPGNALKLQSSSIAVGGLARATTTRPPALSTSSTTDKTSTKTPPTVTAGRQRPSATSIRSSSQPSTFTTASDAKPKGTTTKQPLLSKTSSTIPNQTGSGVSSTNKTSNTATAKTAAVMRTTPSTLTNARARNPLASKTDGRPEEKRISSLKTSTASSTKPKTTTTTTRRTTSGSGASHVQTTAITLPSDRGQVPEKKPLLPRVSRPATSAIATLTTSKSTNRPSTATATSICSNRSKIDSANSMKQHVGGKMPSSSQKRNVAVSQGKSQAVIQKPNITSRLASKDKMMPSPSGGSVPTLNKMLDARKIMLKSSPKDNIKSKPGGHKLKLKSHEVNVGEPTQPKMDSKDIVSPSADGRSIQIDQSQEKGNLPIVGPNPGSDAEKARGPAAQENVLKDEAHSDGEGCHESQPLDSRILETSI